MLQDRIHPKGKPMFKGMSGNKKKCSYAQRTCLYGQELKNLKAGKQIC